MEKQAHGYDALTTKKIRNKLMKLEKEELIKIIDDLVTINKLNKEIIRSCGIDL